MRDIDTREQSAAVKKCRPHAEKIALKRLPASQREIIERVIDGLRTGVRQRQAGRPVSVYFGRAGGRELAAKIGRLLSKAEVE